MKFPTFLMVLMAAAALLTSILETEALPSVRARLKAKRDFFEEMMEKCTDTIVDCRGRPNGARCCTDGHCYGSVCYL
uniref:Conotoxin unassigned superfamily 10 n=1 Tax=Conus ermineus TaxID=55423 RepID=A0A346CJE6_CONER|nr:conotoxin unassigned superfamily 10 [Conus ermineus]